VKPVRVAQRLVRAVPWALVVLGILIFYWVEASLRKTPWLFTDELEWSQLSRAIATTGHAARRGEPHSFESLYSFLIAPAWWIHSTAAAYTAIKYLNAVVMCLAAVPTYLLARMLLVRRTAIIVSLLSIAIPAMSYASSIVPESLAYLWFTLAAWLAVRALAAPGWKTVPAAVVLAGAGVFVRLEFVVLPASLVLAAAIAWILGHGRLSWRRVALAGAAIVVFAFVFNVFVVERLQSWSFGQYFNHDTIIQGGLAAGALAIGLGMLPVIGGIASLWLPDRFSEPSYRAFAIYLGSSLLTLGVYTSAKAAYLVSNLNQTIEERNLFYLSPLLLIGTALALGARKLNWPLVAVGTIATLAVVWSGQFEQPAPYFDAPGLAVLTLVNRDFRWDVTDFHRLLICAAAVSVMLLILRRRHRVPLIAAVVLGVWLLTGEIYAANANGDYADVFAKEIPAPRNWVDADTHGARVTVLGDNIVAMDGNALWLTEFWNRSIGHVASLNGVAPGPGPITAPGLETTDGALSGYTGDPFTLAGYGVRLAAPRIESRDGFTLYRTPTQWHLLDEEQDVFSDGWATSPIGYTYFPRGGPGVLTIHLSRTAFNGAGSPGKATIRVGTVRLDENGTPQLDRVLTVRHRLVPNGKLTIVRIPVASTPVTAVVQMTTFSPPGDTRQLAAQPGFSFKRD
jgi:hypothetical protein